MVMDLTEDKNEYLLVFIALVAWRVSAGHLILALKLRAPQILEDLTFRLRPRRNVCYLWIWFSY